MSLDNARRNCVRSVVVLCGASVALWGCASSRGVPAERGEPTPIAIGDFRSPDAGAAPEVPGSPPETPDAFARPGGNDLVAGADIPPTPAGGGQRRIVVGDGLDFLDAKIGDINGKPIYVTSFFRPIEARLRSLSERENPQQWQRSMVDIVRNRLDSIIFDELLRAETLASLSPEQRVGLQSFIKKFRDDVLSQNLGSAQLANRRLLEQQGVTLDEALRQKELDTLVGLTLHNEINKRINVSWRDVKNRYERDIERFNPPPMARVRVIQVSGDDAEAVEAMTARLEGGASFVEIAESDENAFSLGEDGLREVRLEGAFDETPFFGPAPLNEAIWGLRVGQWAGPIGVGSSHFWVYLEDMVEESMSLYEAQLTIQREIETERREIERQKYLGDLLGRAKVTSREEILLRLISVANRLYAPGS